MSLAGTDVDKECLAYVLYAEAGSSDLTFQGGLKRDCDEEGAFGCSSVDYSAITTL